MQSSNIFYTNLERLVYAQVGLIFVKIIFFRMFSHCHHIFTLGACGLRYTTSGHIYIPSHGHTASTEDVRDVLTGLWTFGQSIMTKWQSPGRELKRRENKVYCGKYEGKVAMI